MFVAYFLIQLIGKYGNILPVEVRLKSMSDSLVKQDTRSKIRASGFETFIDGNQAIPGKMGVSVVPTNFIIDGNGNLVAYAEGYLPWENPQIISFLKEIGKKYASGPSAAKKPASAPVGSVGSVFKISQF